MARTFGGVSTDVVTYTNYADVNNLNLISIAGWSYRTGNGGGGAGRMIAKEDGTDVGFFFHTDNNTYNFQADRWVTTNGIWTIARPAVSTWNHYVITYDYGSTTNDPNIYANGTLQTETEESTPAGTLGTDAGGPVLIGNNSGGIRNWAGDLAEWAIWGGVLLTQDQVTALSQGVCPLLILPESLVFYSPVYGKQSPEPNYVHQNSGTVTGTVGSSRHPKVIMPDRRKLFLPQAAAPAAGLFRQSSLSGLGAGGPFFHDPLAV